MGWVNAEVATVIGAATGIGGLAAAVLLRRYERPVREKLFPELQPHQAYAQVRLITGAVFVAAIVGLCTWFLAATLPPTPQAALPQQDSRAPLAVPPPA